MTKEKLKDIAVSGFKYVFAAAAVAAANAAGQALVEWLSSPDNAVWGGSTAAAVVGTILYHLRGPGKAK